MILKSWAATLFGLSLAVISEQGAHADSLRNAAAITPDNDQQVHFNEVYRVNPHNTYNPHEWHSLTQALDKGARVLELDLYATDYDILDKSTCTTAGGKWSKTGTDQWGSDTFACLSTDLKKIRGIFHDADLQAMAGQPITADPNFLMNYDMVIEHAPSDEDASTSFLSLPWSWVSPDLFYGNNCEHTPVPNSLLGLGPVFTACLQSVRNWMADPAHANHTPIMLYFDVKRDMLGADPVAFDTMLRAVFGDKLYTPAQLKVGHNGTYATPRDRVTSEGWPTMKEMRGKVIAIYTGGEAFAPISGEQPNDTLRTYLYGLADAYVDPAAFVCPKVAEEGDVDSPFSFGHGRTLSASQKAYLMGNVVCNNVYTGNGSGIRHADDLAYERTLSLVNEAKNKHLLTYVWSYNDLLAIYPEVAMDLIAHGVNWFDSEHPSDNITTSPVEFLTSKILPWEGISGITSYGFVLRQQNNPGFVLANDNGKLALRSYTGLVGQQWGVDSVGRLVSMADPRKCVGVTPGRIWTDVHRARADSIYLNVTKNGYDVAPGTSADLVSCNDDTKDTFFTLAPATDHDAGGQTTSTSSPTPDQVGVLLRLNDLKKNNNNPCHPTGASGNIPPICDAQKPPLFLTPSAYNETARFSVDVRNFNKYRLPSGASTGTIMRARGPAAGYDEEDSRPYDRAASDYVYLQAFDLVFDKTKAQPVPHTLDASLVVPPVTALSGSSEPNGGFTPVTWRNYPLSASNITSVLNDGLMSVTEKGLWFWAYDIDRGNYNGASIGQVTAGTLPWWVISRENFVNSTYQGSVSSQMAAEQFMSGSEYAKWLSVANTKADDVPNDGSEDMYYFAENYLNNGEFGEWRDLPATSVPWQNLQYWQIHNNRDIWWMVKNLLAPAGTDPNDPTQANLQYDKWQQRLAYVPSDVALDPQVTYVAQQLLEVNTQPAFYIDSAQDEQHRYFWEQSFSCKLIPPGVPPLDVCGNRYLTRSLGSDGHYYNNGHDGLYHWNMVPFTQDHLIFAEAAFNPQDPAFASHKQPTDWALWQAAAALVASANGRPLTFADVPVDPPCSGLCKQGFYDLIVRASNLLNAQEQQKYYERERLENQFVAQHKTITYLDIDPDEGKAAVAQAYLSAADFQPWQERVDVGSNDVPHNTTFLNSPNAAKLLSTSELATLTAELAVPGHVEGPMPTVWPDIPPAKGKRFAAQTLLPPAEYNKWLEAAAATEADFPQVYTTASTYDLAQKTLSADEFHNWTDIIGATPTQTTSLNWLMFPHRTSAHWIADNLLPASETAIWLSMSTQSLLPQHMGASPSTYHYAKSVLSPADFATWTTYSNQQNKPMNWQAFQYDKSVVEQQIVKTIFGANSSDYKSWAAWAGVTN